MRNKSFSTLLIVIVLVFGIGLSAVSAQCTPSQTGTPGDDNIQCSGSISGNIVTMGGNDTITNDATVTGSGYIDSGLGNDIVTNNGSFGGLYGNQGDDVLTNNGPLTGGMGGSDGNDVITNNGAAYSLGGNDGTDTITNSGTVTTYVSGDDGNDIITNNGTVGTLINGSDGNDIIVNNGTVNGSINGMEDNDTIIINTQTSSGGSDNALTLNGGSGTDVLQFDFYSQDAYNAAAAALAAANPAGGSITINGQTYTWFNFEQLLAILRVAVPTGSSASITTKPWQPDGRLNPEHRGYESVVLYCNGGGYQVYADTGQPLINAGAGTVSSTLADSIAQQHNLMLGQNGQVTLWALFTNEVQVQDDATGYKYIVSAAACA